ILDQIGPNRDVGVMLYGNKVFEDRVDYAISITNGNMNSDIDGDDRKELVGRFVTRPFNSEDYADAFHRLGFGISLSTDVNQTPINQNAVRTPFGVTWFQFNSGVRLDGLRNRIGPEASYFNGGFGLAAQYLYQTAEYRAAPATATSPIPPRVTVPFNGFWV